MTEDDFRRRQIELAEQALQEQRIANHNGKWATFFTLGATMISWMALLITLLRVGR